MPIRPRTLLVGHDASRTGAPIAALELIRWLQASGAAEVTVVLRRGGPLVVDYAAVAPTRVDDGLVVRGLDAVDHLLAWPRLRDGATRVTRRGWPGRPGPDPDMVVANTLASLASAVSLAPRRARMVCWVHELDGVADRLLATGRRAPLLARVDHFVAAGRWTTRMLIERWGIAPGRVTCLDEPIAPVPTPAAAVEPPVQVLGAGSLVARKGPDAFVAAVALLARDRPGLRAAWVGDGDPAVRGEVEADLASARLVRQLRLAGEVSDLGPWWPTEGVLLHTAREDPFPLVAIEAGARSVPVVTWGTGGAADLLVRSGLANLVAPAGDVIGLARRVGSLLDDPDARQAAGTALRDQAQLLLVDRQAPLIWAACLGTSP